MCLALWETREGHVHIDILSASTLSTTEDKINDTITTQWVNAREEEWRDAQPELDKALWVKPCVGRKQSAEQEKNEEQKKVG